MGVKQALRLVTVLVLVTMACNLNFIGSSESIPRNAIVVDVTTNSGLTPWIQQVTQTFNTSETTLENRPIFIRLQIVEAGQAVVDMTNGNQPDLWIPDHPVWVEFGRENGIQSFNNCESVVESPLIIGMWRPIAEALGWPGRSLGWLDIGSLASDSSAWAYYSGNQFGPNLRIGHAHPGLSHSGISTLLAVVHAAEAQSEAVNVDDIQQPIVQASVRAFESGVSLFSTSTDELGQTMSDRGAEFLAAAVMYESTVINHRRTADIVPIYPFEGTFLATHPACLNETTASPEVQEATQLFRDYLLNKTSQELAVSYGLRPTDTEVELKAPLDPSYGVDLAQPAVIFEAPSVETLYATQDLWQSARKPVNLVMLIDTSGSMNGTKIQNVRQSASQFVEQMGDDDFISIVSFSTSPILRVNYQPIEGNRAEIKAVINRLDATGGTALYDAIGDAAALIERTNSPEVSNVMVVLTDGRNNGSQRFAFNNQLVEAAAANDTTVFTIAYGSDADEGVLQNLAEQAKGNFYLGDEANIDEIYEEMSAIFGGSVGIGR